MLSEAKPIPTLLVGPANESDVDKAKVNKCGIIPKITSA